MPFIALALIGTSIGTANTPNMSAQDTPVLERRGSLNPPTEEMLQYINDIEPESEKTDPLRLQRTVTASLKKITYWRYILDLPLITREVLHYHYEGAGTPEDPYQLTWIEGDPRSPLQMPMARKAVITAIMAILTLAASFMSSTYSGYMPQIIEAFHVSEELATAGLSLYVLGFGVGPLFWAPLGEMFGRQITMFVAYGLFTVTNGGAVASQNIQTLLVLRFLSGCFAACALVNTGAVLADIFKPSERGLAMGLFAMAPFMGPVFGPIIGGFMGQSSAGWRWVQGLSAIFSGVLWLITALVVPETYAPVLLRKRAKKMSEMTGKTYKSVVEIKFGAPKTLTAELKTAMARPFLLISLEPIILFLALYMSILYGILYMLFGAFPIVYQEGRGWNQGVGGLAFIGVMVGELIAILMGVPDNARYQRRFKARGGTVIPEERLFGAMIGAISVPIGLFWFAWTNGPEIPWIVSIIATSFFGFGIVLLFISIKNYLVDAYTVYAASAIASTVVLRSTFGAAFPLFTTYMYHNLGIHWASTLTAFLSLLCAPIPFVLVVWGKKIRAKSHYAKSGDAMAGLLAK